MTDFWICYTTLHSPSIGSKMNNFCNFCSSAPLLSNLDITEFWSEVASEFQVNDPSQKIFDMPKNNPLLCRWWIIRNSLAFIDNITKKNQAKHFKIALKISNIFHRYHKCIYINFRVFLSIIENVITRQIYGSKIIEVSFLMRDFSFTITLTLVQN